MCVGIVKTAGITFGDITAIPLNRLRINSMSVASQRVAISVARTRHRPKRKMPMSDKNYDCSTCPYPRYKDGSVIFCYVCIQKIMDGQKEKSNKESEGKTDG